MGVNDSLIARVRGSWGDKLNVPLSSFFLHLHFFPIPGLIFLLVLLIFLHSSSVFVFSFSWPPTLTPGFYISSLVSLSLTRPLMVLLHLTSSPFQWNLHLSHGIISLHLPLC